MKIRVNWFNKGCGVNSGRALGEFREEHPGVYEAAHDATLDRGYHGDADVVSYGGDFDDTMNFASDFTDFMWKRYGIYAGYYLDRSEGDAQQVNNDNLDVLLRRVNELEGTVRNGFAMVQRTPRFFWRKHKERTLRGLQEALGCRLPRPKLPNLYNI